MFSISSKLLTATLLSRCLGMPLLLATKVVFSLSIKYEPSASSINPSLPAFAFIIFPVTVKPSTPAVGRINLANLVPLAT